MDDIRGNDEPEDESFNDTDASFAAQWREFKIRGKRRVMNDGCARISLGAARLIWRALGGTGNVPSVFQGRIGGAKGVWMRSHNVESVDPEAEEIWIEISQSQLKFKPADEDHGPSYDPNRLTFDVVKASHSPMASTLHLSFITILLNRGVPASTLEGLITAQLDATLADISDSIADPKRLRSWLGEHYAMLEDIGRESTTMPSVGALPAKLLEKIIFLLEAGFSPCENSFLGGLTQRIVARYYSRLLNNLRFRLGKSCTMMGVADPSGRLRPGQLHVSFSEGFVDKDSGTTYPFLDGREILVARHPALRSSDVQRCRTVFLKELNHLRDVVVFPSTGTFPTAAKLQGGDYDGDTFWICWEDSLVKPFRNAPAPVESPRPEDFGIAVDRRLVRDVLDPAKIHRDPSGVDNFLRKSFAFASLPSLLGEVTNLHEKLSHRENTIHGDGLGILADLHDLLVDSAKNGYRFTREAYEALLAAHSVDVGCPMPAWKDAMQEDFEKQYNATAKSFVQQSNMYDGLHLSRKRNSRRYDRQKFLDRLLFEVVRPRIADSLDKTKALLHLKDSTSQLKVEESLLYPFLKAKECVDDTVQKELAVLEFNLKRVRQIWSGCMEQSTSAEKFTAAVRTTYEEYLEVQPDRKGHPMIAYWLTDYAAGAPTHWDLIKASLFYKLGCTNALPFHLAGRELAYLKAFASGESWRSDKVRIISNEVWGIMKPRKRITNRLVAQQTIRTASTVTVGVSLDDDEYPWEGDWSEESWQGLSDFDGESM